MQQVNGSSGNAVKITDVVGGIKLVTTEVKVDVPVYEEVTVKVPKFEEQIVKVPVGMDDLINKLALEMSKSAIAIIEAASKKQLALLEEKIASLRNIKTQEDVVLKTREVEVEKPVFIDKPIQVDRVVMVDRQVINPILKNVEVTNAIVIDKAVTNCIVNDIRVTNAIIKDVEVERAVIREKIIEVIHKQCMDEKGNSL